MLKFLADMGISPDSVRHLQKLNYNAIHLMDENLSRLPDGEIIHKARNEQRVILTHDLDFGDLMAASREILPSVIIFRMSDMRPANENAHLRQILDSHQDILAQGAILSVSQGKVRVRRLPILK